METKLDYYYPETVEAAIEKRDQTENCSYFAGGTDLMVKYKNRLDELGFIIDITGLEELKKIEQNGNQISIGALVTHQDILDSALIAKYLPSLQQAAAEVGSPQIRHRGTIGGNIANASPAADLVPVLIAAGAEIEYQGPNSSNCCLLEDIFLAPGEISLEQGELITEIKFDIPQANEVIAFNKLGKRKALAISVVNLALYLKLDSQKRVEKARICYGSVAPTPLRIKEAEQYLTGKKISRKSIERVKKIVKAEVKPITDIRSTASYRSNLSAEMLEQSLAEVSAQLEVSL